MQCVLYNVSSQKKSLFQQIINTGTSKKHLSIMKKVNIFGHSFQKVKPIYYIDSLHIVKYFKPIFLEILIIMAYR